MQRSALCRSRRELSNAYLLAKFGFDTAENEPCKVCPLSVYRLLQIPQVFEYGDELLKQKRAERAKRQRAVEKSQRKRDSFLAARSVAEKGRSTVKAVDLPPSAMFFLTPS